MSGHGHPGAGPSWEEFLGLGAPGGDSVQSARIGEIERDWPWADVFFHLPFEIAHLNGAPDTASAIIAEMTEGLDGATDALRGRLAALLGRFRGFDTDANLEWAMPDGLLGLASLPPEWLPRTSPFEDSEEWWTAIHLARDAYRISRAVGKPAKALLQGVGRHGWLAYVEDLSDRLGFDEGEGREELFRDFLAMEDMVMAFEGEVLMPALHRNGRRIGLDPHYERGDLAEGPDYVLRRASLGLLLGDKSLLAFAEVTRRWHAARTEMGLALSPFATASGLRWDSPLRPWAGTVGGRDYDIRCLTSARELFDEGGADVDEDGFAGLDHCVASYLDSAATQASYIVSVRQGGPGGRGPRLSTAEVVYQAGSGKAAGKLVVRQHHGRMNRRVPNGAGAALAAYLAVERPGFAKRRGSEHELRARNAKRPFPGLYDADIPGSVEALIKAWDPLMPKAARGLSPHGLLERCGLLTP